MMKWILIPTLVSFLSVTTFPRDVSLDHLRKSYALAVTDKNLCQTLISNLKAACPGNVHLAYLGAFQTIWANHVFNPFSKLKTFNTGKKNIETAVANENMNIEIRFIRLSVQMNCPGFLGYSSNKTEDRDFLKTHITQLQPGILKGMIEKILK